MENEPKFELPFPALLRRLKESVANKSGFFNDIALFDKIELSVRTDGQPNADREILVIVGSDSLGLPGLLFEIRFCHQQSGRIIYTMFCNDPHAKTCGHHDSNFDDVERLIKHFEDQLWSWLNAHTAARASS